MNSAGMVPAHSSLAADLADHSISEVTTRGELRYLRVRDVTCSDVQMRQMLSCAISCYLLRAHANVMKYTYAAKAPTAAMLSSAPETFFSPSSLMRSSQPTTVA